MILCFVRIGFNDEVTGPDLNVNSVPSNCLNLSSVLSISSQSLSLSPLMSLKTKQPRSALSFSLSS